MQRNESGIDLLVKLGMKVFVLTKTFKGGFSGIYW